MSSTETLAEKHGTTEAEMADFVASHLAARELVRERNGSDAHACEFCAAAEAPSSVPSSVAYRYCGRDYTAKVVGRWRVRVLRSSCFAGSWQVLATVRFTTGSGRTHTKEAVMGGNYGEHSEAAHLRERAREGRELMAALGREKVRVSWPRTSRADWRSAAKIYSAAK
jgi:hypothetical protein